jgi:DNA repair exonuclease SbcCD ATPase subunit
MIIFDCIRYKNLLSTGNVFTEINLNSHNTTLIVGENGAGKSTLLDALSFVLFGKPFRKINKPQLLNSITQKGLIVEVEFSVGSNKYKIVRGIKPNVFEVYQNNILLNQSAEMKDYQEVLEKQILKVNHKSFCQVVVLGSATFQPFMQLSASQRREIIEDLLDLQIFTTMNSLLKDKIIINSDCIKDVASEKKLVEEKIKLIRKHLLEMQNDNKQLIEEKKNRIADTNTQIDSLNTQYWEIENKRKDLEESIKDETSLSKKIKSLTKFKHQIEAKRATLNNDINFFKKHANCPTCTQKISEDFRENAISIKAKEVETIDSGLDQLIEQYEAANKSLNDIMNIHSEINSNKMEIHKIKTNISYLIDYVESMNEEIKNIQKKEKREDKTQIDEYEKKLIEVENNHTNLLNDRLILQAASTLLKDGGIKSRIVKQYIPIINKLINKYLASMEFMCQFELDENFSEKIKSRYRDEFSYASFSEGEKQKIDIALLFTWRAIAKLRNSINTNLLIFDEILDSSLDADSIDYFMGIIKSFANNSNIFIISHREQMGDKFDKTIKFHKVKNFSRLVDE